jgi:hypothetical protein
MVVAPASKNGATARRDAAWLRASLAGVWLATALTMFAPYYQEVGTGYLARFGLPPWIMWATNGGELAVALWVLRGPMSRLLAALQIGAVLAFTILLAVIEPMLLVSPFGMLTKNIPFVAVVIAAYLLERERWTARVERLLAIGMACIWITEGLFPKLLFQQSIELDMAPAAGLTFAPPWLLVGAVGVLQVASGIAVLLLPRRPRAWLLFAQTAALLVLPLIVGFIAPYLWVHPFGPFSKNLPILTGTFLLYRRCSRSS